MLVEVPTESSRVQQDLVSPLRSQELRTLTHVTNTSLLQPQLLEPNDWSPSAAIIFDGDDTLWETEALYDRARSDAAQVVASAGYDPETFETLQRTIDGRNVTTMGLSAERFPTSSVEAFEELARRAGAVVSREARHDVYLVSAAVFDAKAPVLPFADELLASLAGSVRLLLLTKGDEVVQMRRVDSSGLRHYFDSVEIVADKGVGTYQRLLQRIGAEPSMSWSIGNSLPSDVAPALLAGTSAIWIDAHVWEHERREHGADMSNPRLHVAAGLRDVPAILALATQTLG
jgi:putative hydrolase of the HAD superfamily